MVNPIWVQSEEYLILNLQMVDNQLLKEDILSITI